MRRNRKIRKMEPWYRRLFERIKENRNRINRGTTEPKILENPFISRAYDKIMRNHRNHVLGMCLSGIIGGHISVPHMGCAVPSCFGRIVPGMAGARYGPDSDLSVFRVVFLWIWVCGKYRFPFHGSCASEILDLSFLP